MISKTPAEYVNPYIGTVGHLLTGTRPKTMYPHGAAQIFPNVLPVQHDYYFSDKISSFPVGPLEIMFGSERSENFSDSVSHFDISAVIAHPYLYSVYLEDTHITVLASTTKNCYAYKTVGAKKLFIYSDKITNIFLSDKNISVKLQAGHDLYIKIFFNNHVSFISDKKNAIVLNLPETCEIIAAVSNISFDKADEIYHKEAADKSFDTIADESKNVWNSLLGKIRISGGSEDKKTVYYTSLYRSFGKMTDMSEYGEYYSGYDNKTHSGNGFYAGDQLWDSFRSMHPLQLLLEPENHKNVLDSYVEMYKQSGAMPSFPGFDGDSPVMLGFHAAALFADGLAKGIDTDYETAYEGLYRNATQITMLPWVADRPATELDRCYYEKGYFPGLEPDREEYIPEVHDFENRQCVAVTLEHAYDDWCVAQIARHLGKKDDYLFFMKRAKNYVNVYNKSIGFMAPKNINGEWIKDYDPMLSGGQGGRAYFAECNAYTFNFSVWHDIEGLAELMGGKDALCDRLDELFTTPCLPNKYTFLRQFPDSTGLMGMFCMGNEPSFHIPYFYNYCGKPWMTQRRMRTIMDIWFTNSPLGICGDEDGGAMSSWFAFSAIGLYPVCPGKSEYAVSSPIFDNIEISVEGGTFRISAIGAGDGKRYIQSAKLNGKELNRAFIDHKDIVSGGELILEMGNMPNRSWGIENN